MSRWDAESPFGSETDAAHTASVAETGRATGSASPSSEGRSEISHDSPLDAAAAQDSLYLTHKITKLDTLAGIAVKYGVTVSDIKRLNSLLSDSAMFARSTLLVPTKQLPVGEDVAMWVGMIVSGYGRHAGMQPGTKPKMDKDHLSMMGFRPPASEALSKLNDFYGLADAAAAQGAAEAARRKEAARLAAAKGGSVEVELMNVNNSFAGEREGPKMDDRLRRRGGASGQDATDEYAPLVDSLDEQPTPNQRTFSAAFTPRAAIAGQAVKKETFFDKLRRAASQPVLAGPPRVGSNLSNAADGIILGADLSRAGSSSMRQPGLPPLKAGGKKD
eukprot:CAMPEP_0177795776 /NCGR_PEP_ID=MMETSP0491_2-20121128/26423_1 /TAXON_ID=63592 /ORGANISM="Tetraselmis chuii, Strain PLY429" /LENGTH=331 /DNA_ID=CAMNT_0019318649 /DNA_START=215 /DNA_END=1210 /DNA_ORIENTATION=-